MEVKWALFFIKAATFLKSSKSLDFTPMPKRGWMHEDFFQKLLFFLFFLEKKIKKDRYNLLANIENFCYIKIYNITTFRNSTTPCSLLCFAAKGHFS
jgi:hypothetical protein